MNTTPTSLEIEPGQAADVAAAFERHPFFKRLAATEHDDQPTTANASADEMVAAIAGHLDGTGADDQGDTDEVGEQTLDDGTSGQDDGADSTLAPSSEPTPPAPEPPATYTLRNGDEDITLTAEQVQAMLAINQWAAGVQPEVARQFAAVEQGVAVAVPTDEYAAYQVWLQTQQQPQQPQRGQYPQQQSPVAGSVPEWVQDLDPEAQAFFANLQVQNAQMQQHLAALEQQTIAAQQPQLDAQQQQVASQFDAAVQSYAQANGLTNDQAGELLDIAVRAQIIPTLAESQRTYSPSGIMVRDADYALIARQALDFGRLQRPDLATGQAPASATGAGDAGAAPEAPASNPNPNIPVAPTTHTVDPVAMKKARSASLAAAPSAATVPPGFDPATANPQDLRNAMANFLREKGIAS